MWSGTVIVIGFSRKALLCDYEGDRQWVAKSQIHDDSEVWADHHIGNEATLVISEWLADKLGWSE
jgi:hypothetical protein